MAVTPARADAAGGSTIAIVGTGFAPNAEVRVGGVPCTGVAATSTRITCVLPASAALGPADVLVTNPSAVTSETAPAALVYEGFTPAIDVRPTSTPGGATQSAPVLVPGPAGSLYCVFEDDRRGDLDVRLAWSVDGGLTWSPNVRVDDDVGVATQREPALAIASGGALVCAFVDERSGDADVRVARSLDGGLTWSASVRLSDDLTGASQASPALAAGPNGAIYCAWVDARLLPSGVHSPSIFLSRSLDGGQTWTFNVRIGARAAAFGTPPALTVRQDGVVVLTWGSLTWRSVDRGTTWTRPVDVVGNQHPDLTSSSSVLVRVAGNGVRVNRSTDDGDTWTTHVLEAAVVQTVPAIAAAPSGSLACAWSRLVTGGQETVVTTSLDAGLTWTTPVVASDQAAPRAFVPAVTIAWTSAGALVCAWRDDRANDPNIYVTRSLDGGLTWSANASTVSDDAVERDLQRNPQVVELADGTVLALWEDDRSGHDDIWAARSVDGGKSWSASTRVNDVPLGEQERPSLAVLPTGELVVAWRQVGGTIHLAASVDGGATWDPSRLFTAAGPGASIGDPRLAVASDGGLVCTFVREAGTTTEVCATRSVDLGTTWTDFLALDTRAQRPDIASGPSGLMAVVYEARVPNEADVRCRVSVDAGRTWGPAVKAAREPIPASNTDQLYPTVTITRAGTVLATWFDEVQIQVRHARSSDQGATWSTATSLPEWNQPRFGLDGVGAPVIAFPSLDDRLRAWRSTDDGVAFPNSRTTTTSGGVDALAFGTTAIHPRSDGAVGILWGSQRLDDDYDLLYSTLLVLDFFDVDQDGDGLADGFEGRRLDGSSVDTDLDTVPDHLDPDSDDDGVGDEVEGVGDGDGDGVPRWRDGDES